MLLDQKTYLSRKNVDEMPTPPRVVAPHRSPLIPALSPVSNDRNVGRDGKPTEVVAQGGEGAPVGTAELCITDRAGPTARVPTAGTFAFEKPCRSGWRCGGGLVSRLVGCLLAGCGAAVGWGQEKPPPSQIRPPQQLALAQLDQLIAAGEAQAAVGLAVRLIDEADERLVPASQVVAGEASRADIERWVPLEMVVHDRLLQTGGQQPAVLEAYRAAYDRIAQDALQAAVARDSVAALERFLRRYFATSWGDEGLLRLSEQAWRRGWVLRARDALRRIDPRWQPHAAATESGAAVEAVDWEQLLGRVPASSVPELADEVAGRPGRPFGSYHGSDLPQADVAVRLIACQLLLGNRPVAEQLARVAGQWFPEATVRIAGRAGSITAMAQWLVEEAGPWPAAGRGFSQPLVPGWSTFGGHPQRVATAGTETLQWQAAPRWVAPFDAGTEMLKPLLPEFARRGREAERAVSLPVIERGRVFLAGTRRLHAWELATGTAWPPGAGEGGWFETPAEPLAEEAKRLPIDAVPRLTLTVADGLLAARFGSLLTTPPDVLLDRPSGSEIALFSLAAEGALVEGYPLAPPAGSEFEGTPLLVGSRLWVGTTHRDEATRLSRLCCYDRATGVLLWQSRPLTQLLQAGSAERGHVSQALASYAEGIVYFHADQGTVAAVAADSGRILWQVRYPRRELDPRQELAARPFDASPGRTASRSAPVAICGPRAIVSASDFDRLMALDPIDGRLIWMTPRGGGAAVAEVLGEVDGCLILGGRQLEWLEASSGRTVARFPGAGTPQPGGGQRQPTGVGRGVLSGQQIIWPTEQKLLVFAARLAAGPRRGEPQLVDQIDLRPWGLRGGQLAVGDRFLVNAGPHHVAVFAGRLRPARRSMTLTE